MSEKNWDSIEGIIDVGPIVVAHCDNPAKELMVEFIGNVLMGKIRALLPVSTFIGAYHILTRYLRVARHDAIVALKKTLSVDSPAYYEEISKGGAIEALQLASINNIQGWDGYLLNIGRIFGTRIIYTLDLQLDSVEGFSAVLPIAEDAIQNYHAWVQRIRAKFENK